MYSVRLRRGARHGETPRIGGNPKDQPISELDIFSKRQALSRAVVVNSNMSRRKYLAREGPGSRLSKRQLATSSSKTELTAWPQGALRRFAVVSPFCFGYPAQLDIAS